MAKMPEPVKPWEAAGAQSAADMFKGAWDFTNKNISEVTPYGSKTYAQTGTNKVFDPFSKQYIDVPTYTSNVQLSDAENDLLKKNTQMRGNVADIGVQQSGRLLNHLGQPINTQGLQAWNAGPQAPKLATTFGDAGPIQKSIASQDIRQDQTPTDRAAVERAMMERYQRDAAPRNAEQEAVMAARGMSPGGQGHDTLLGSQGRDRLEAETNAFLASGQESRAAQDAYNSAAMEMFGQSATQGAFANSAQMQQYQQMLQRAGFSNEAIANMFAMQGQTADRGNALRQNQWTERLSERNQPINEVMSFLGGVPINTPQFNAYNPPSTQGVPIGQMMYDEYNAKSTQAQNSLAGIAGIGSAVAGALPWASWLGGLSDRRAKTDIHPIEGARLAGAQLYTFRYWTDEPETVNVGVMADEVRPLHPDAVRQIDGWDHVNYDMLRRRHAG